MLKMWKPLLLLAALGVMVFGMLNSGAWFTETQTTQTGSITAGILNLNDEGITTVNLGTIPNMEPGDKEGEMVVTITNVGNINLAWFGDLIVEGNEQLREAIYIDFAQMEYLSPTGKNWQTQGTDNFILNGRGHGNWPTAYETAANLSPFQVITLKNFDGGNFMGVKPFEFNGALKPDYSYRLTLRFGFAEDATETYEGLGPLYVKLAVHATQIKEGALKAMDDPADGEWAYSSILNWLNNQIADQTEE